MKLDFNKKPIIGMIHLSGSDTESKISRALKEINIYIEEGLNGCIIENYHGDVSNVEAVLKSLRDEQKNKISIGINILPNDFETAFMLANKYGGDFIQLDYVAGNYVNVPRFDVEKFFKLINESPNQIDILGGVWPKYYTPVTGSDLVSDVIEGGFMAEAVVVTGSGTGKETPLEKIQEFRQYLKESKKFRKTPLVIGAGLDATNVATQLPFAEGAIVGSCFKPFKRTQEMINRELVKEFMDEVKKVRG